MPIAHLNNMIDKLKHYKEETFTERFLLEIKRELLKLLQLISEFVFDFNHNVKDYYLHEERLKNRARNTKNRLTMEILRENRRDKSINNSGNALEMMRLHNNSDHLESAFRMFPSDWRKDTGERSNRVA